MASAFARCVPGGYDTNYTVAKALTHASLGCALLGCAGGYLGTGYLSSLAAMHALMLISLETSSRALLKYCALSTWWTMWLDVIFLASYATDFISSSQGYTSGQLRGNEVVVGMVCIIFMLRFPQFFVWQKLWHLGFKTPGQGAPRYVDYGNPAAGTQPQQQREMGSPQQPREPAASAFAQPPHASSMVVRSPPPAVPAAFSPTPISQPAPAVVSFTPAMPSNNNV